MAPNDAPTMTRIVSVLTPHVMTISIVCVFQSFFFAFLAVWWHTSMWVLPRLSMISGLLLVCHSFYQYEFSDGITPLS